MEFANLLLIFGAARALMGALLLLSEDSEVRFLPEVPPSWTGVTEWVCHSLLAQAYSPVPTSSPSLSGREGLIEKLVPCVEESSVAEENDPDGSHGRSGGDEKHDHHLVLHCLNGVDSRK